MRTALIAAALAFAGLAACSPDVTPQQSGAPAGATAPEPESSTPTAAQDPAEEQPAAAPGADAQEEGEKKPN